MVDCYEMPLRRQRLEQHHGLRLEPGDMLVSFDAVSLFTMVPVQEVLGFIGELFLVDITTFFQQVLTTMYFHWNDGLYEQIDGVVMGSPLSP